MLGLVLSAQDSADRTTVINCATTIMFLGKHMYTDKIL